MSQSTYTFIKGRSPLVATAIHDGHLTRASLTQFFKLDESGRLREEDPFTAEWVKFCDNQIIVHHSRFETDVNRAREQAVYLRPEDAWGLEVWQKELPKEALAESLAVYDAFYKEAKNYFDSLFAMHENLVVYDIHSYNHRREGENIEADADTNPEVNMGTRNMNQEKWRPLLDAVIENFQTFDYDGRNLDVRENVKFKGGYFGQWLYEQYGDKICPISVEFKKFFMDEWTAEPFQKDIKLIDKLLKNSEPTVMEQVDRLKT